jgi:hypothetical protein
MNPVTQTRNDSWFTPPRKRITMRSNQAAAQEYTVCVPRGGDGRLPSSLKLGSDPSSGRPCVQGAPSALHMRQGDIIVAVEGTEVSSLQQIAAELKRSAATGHNVASDMLRLRIRRPTAHLQPVQWATSALTLAARTNLAVPLTIEAPSLGSYSFACVSGGSIEFSISVQEPGATADAPLVSSPGPASRADGTFRVAAPCVVTAHLDNSASILSSVTIACVVSMTPLAELLAAETVAIEAAHAQHTTHLQMLEDHENGLLAQERELERALAEMRRARLASERVRAVDAAAAAGLGALAVRLHDAPTAVAVARAARRDGEAVLAAEGVIAAARRARKAAADARSSVRERSEAAEKLIEAEEARRSRHGERPHAES